MIFYTHMSDLGLMLRRSIW